MSNELNSGELLATARNELLGKLLAELPDGLRYEMLMIANAMAIAMREMADGGNAVSHEAKAWSTLLGAAAEGRSEFLPMLRRRLCLAIRAGAFDAPGRKQALLDVATEVTRMKLAISNPKAIA